jgi:hypothetical protein
LCFVANRNFKNLAGAAMKEPLLPVIAGHTGISNLSKSCAITVALRNVRRYRCGK